MINNKDLKIQTLTKFKHLVNKKFFEFKDWNELYPDCFLFMIKGKKGIGKTYQLLEYMRDMVKREVKFVFMRTTDKEVQSLKTEWNHNDIYPFMIVANVIYEKQWDSKTRKLIKGRQVGLIYHVNNLSPLKSLQFEGYEAILYDEYVATSLSEYRNVSALSRKWMSLLIDVQRDKPNLKVWMFGNNNLETDPFIEYFDITTVDNNIYYDKKAGVLIANLKDMYVGVVNESKGGKLAKYSKAFEDYLKDNVSYEDKEFLSNYDPEHDALLLWGLIFDNKYYVAQLRPKLMKGKKEFDEETIFIDCLNDHVDSIPNYSVDIYDSLSANRSTTRLVGFHLCCFLNMVMDLFRTNSIAFTKQTVKEQIKLFLRRYQHYSNIVDYLNKPLF